MATFAKPENALKRAEELMNVGQKQAALQALHDLITSKRYRAWQKTLERIMFKYVELCVDMKKGRFAKDGLIQYRIVCQQVNVSSLEEVIKYFLKLSSERAERAHSQAVEVTLDIEDLEAEKRPEDLMLSYVSGEKGKERSDRELVTPWFKFLWETYRTVLEILRNNSKLEALYAMTAHRAFQFCLQYQRTTEFRRLCEILRNHLTNLNKYRDQRDRPDLSQPESLQLYLETRFEQLKVATELELWQEAFRSIEDIHGLMAMVKRSPKPQMMAIYYAKLTKIFWVSESHLYHAYAWYKLYNLQKSYNKNLTQKDLQLMASSVLLATLSVKPYDRKHGAHHFELEMEKDRNVRMANLLGFTLDPKRDTREVLSRGALLSELVSKGVMTYVSQDVKDLFNLLENEFHPLDLAAKVQPLLGRLSKLSDKLSSASPVPEVQLEQYIPALEILATLRVLQQVSQVYQTTKITNLAKMIPFFDFSLIEKLAVDAVKFNYVHIKIDHLSGIVHVDNQDLESEKIKNHLTILSKRLNKALAFIQPVAVERLSRQSFSSSDLQEKVEKEHKKLLARKVLIERRKEEHERQMLEMEREEESKRLKQQRLTEEAEAKRLANESARREEARIRKEIEEKDLEEARLLLAEAEKRKGKKGKKAAPDGEITKLTKQILIEEALTEQMKERQEMERKLQKLSKTMDYLERAKREEERPLMESAYHNRLADDEVFYAQQQQLMIEQSQSQHVEDLIEKIRLMKMVDDKNVFQTQVVSRRQGEFEKLLKEREERLAEIRHSRRLDCERRRKMEFYRQQEESRLSKIRAEEEARKREEEGRRQKEEAERRAKYDEIAAKQQQREAEADERARREREAILVGKPLDDGKPGRFIPSSMRKRIDEPLRREPETWRPPVEERRPALFNDNRAFSNLEDGDRRQRSSEIEQPPAPQEGTAPGKYQPPRSTSRYEPPVRREAYGGSRNDGAPRPASGRFSFDRSDRESERPRTFDKSERGDERWGRVGPDRQSVRGVGFGSDKAERSSTLGVGREDGSTDNWRRPPNPEGGKEAGNGSGARKKDLVLSLLRACRGREMKYIVRTLIQNMRIGAMMKTVLSALAQAVVLHHSFSAGEAADKALVKLKPKFQEASAVVMEAYNFLPNLDIIVPTMIKDGVGELSANFTISPGTPIKPMLAKITNGIPELLKRFQGQPFTCEYKYDGQRAQIHMLLDGTVRIFSRDSGDSTGRFPDVINIVRDAASEDLKSFIIDAEVVAVDRENDNKLMAFQHLSTRERGGRDGDAVSLQSIKVSDRKKQLVIQDLSVLNFGGSSDSKPIRLLRNHEVRCSLVKIPFQERRQRMHHWFPNTRPGYFGYANEITIEAEEDPESTSQKVLGYLEEAFAASCEGLMAKALLNDSSYMASKRSDSWLKIKRDYVEGLQDSLDLVPIGAWHGNGRKAGWYSPFLLACYDPDSEEYQSVCRVMSGFTDVFYKEITQFYTGDHVLPRKPPYYRTGEEPDVWLTPEIVWEIRGADFTVSPVHQAAVGLIHPSRGISMRFPRFIRSRPDKKPDIASTPSDVAHLFHGQTRKLDVPGSKVKVVSRSDSQE